MIQNSSNLMKYAIEYLSKYSSSKGNLERVLKNKIIRLKIEKKTKYILYNSIQKIIEELERKNYINDYNYSSAKINYFFNQGKSKMFIKNYFIQKNINKDIIDETFEKFEKENNDWELISAKTFARKKKMFGIDNSNEKNLARLARAGFNYEIAKKILEID